MFRLTFDIPTLALLPTNWSLTNLPGNSLLRLAGQPPPCLGPPIIVPDGERTLASTP